MTADLKAKLKDQSVIPEVVPEYPQDILDVTYADNVKVDLGNTLTPTQVKKMPVVKWKADSGNFYLLCMTDPDAPSRSKPVMREWHHWLVGNIPGDDISKGETLSEYIGSGPPKDTGKHRYVFMLYKQKNKIHFTEPHLTNKSGNGRGKFSIKKFADKHKLGDPIAGNFFLAEWDDYVPILYKQLK